jgi:formate dehydrogenase accessory protein FdhE
VKIARAGPADFESRLARARSIETTAATAAPMRLLIALFAHQLARTGEPSVGQAAFPLAADATARRLVEEFPLLDLSVAAEPIAAELEQVVMPPSDVVSAAPAPLATSARALAHQRQDERLDLARTWLDDPDLLDPRTALWIKVAAAPILEFAAAHLDPVPREEWSGRACPVCGDVAQASAIVEESDGFLQGAPRYLICGRCQTWWGFPRVMCPLCGEDDSRRISPFVADGQRWVRLDVGDTCHGYVKTFDLREAQAAEVVPPVDDVATLALDVWAHEQGLHRAALSLAGV